MLKDQVAESSSSIMVDDGAGQQDASDANMPQIIADSVPQLQAQVQQLSQMLQNPALPASVRQQTEMQHQAHQMQLAHAQAIAAALAASHTQGTAATMNMPMPGMGDGFVMGGMNGGGGFMGGAGWANQFGVQGQVNDQDSAYQRLPVNNRRRNLKRERPSDFVEVGGVDGDVKQPRYWE
jgi:protein MPE1